VFDNGAISGCFDVDGLLYFHRWRVGALMGYGMPKCLRQIFAVVRKDQRILIEAKNPDDDRSIDSAQSLWILRRLLRRTPQNDSG
jgi:hypothetical protein